MFFLIHVVILVLAALFVVDKLNDNEQKPEIVNCERQEDIVGDLTPLTTEEFEKLKEELRQLKAEKQRSDEAAAAAAKEAREAKEAADKASKLAAVKATRLIPWQYDYDKAWKLALELHRPTMTYYCREGCEPCDRVASNVFTDKRVMDIVKRDFVPVWAYASADSQDVYKKAKEAGVTRWPSIVMCDEEGCRVPFVPSDNPEVFLNQVQQER